MASADRKECKPICDKTKSEWLDMTDKKCKPCLDSAGKMPSADRLECVCKAGYYKKSDDDTCF
jgi:hypothetical protein